MAKEHDQPSVSSGEAMNRDEVVSAVTPFEYLLNAMENAAAQGRPSDHDYCGKRQAVLKYVSDSELRIQELMAALGVRDTCVVCGASLSAPELPHCQDCVVCDEAALSAKEKKP